MADNDDDFPWGMAVGAGLVLAFQLMFGDLGAIQMKRDAVAAGAAYYHAQTGELKFGCTGGTR